MGVIRMKLDNIDLHILKELTEDARVGLSVISSHVNLSLPAVSERIKKLEKNGYIEKYTVILNPEKFNKTLTCFTFITLKYSEGDLERFRMFVKSHPEILECHLVTGEYEYILKIVSESPKSLGILLDSLRKSADVLTTSTSISLTTVKNKVSINLNNSCE